MTAQISLFFKEGSSDKEYHVQLEQSGAGHVVNFQYGRRGSTLTQGTKTPSPLPLEKAEKIYSKLVAEKKAKGYTEGASGTPYVGGSKEERVTGLFPQLLNPIEENEVEQYLSDSAWGAQEKKDGKHIMLRVKGGKVTGSNRKGLEIGLPEPIVNSARDLEDCVLDGEAVGDDFYAFDLLESNGKNLASAPYLNRYAALISTCSNAIKVVPFAMKEKDKRTLLERLKTENKEGIVFKKLSSTYKSGRPCSGGDMLKFKFYATCSCVVGKGREGKRSVGLYLTGPAGSLEMVPVGNVTVPANQNIPNLGQVVEVRYLYGYKDGSLYQPVLLGVRDDVGVEACGMGQIKYKADEE